MNHNRMSSSFENKLDVLCARWILNRKIWGNMLMITSLYVGENQEEKRTFFETPFNTFRLYNTKNVIKIKGYFLCTTLQQQQPTTKKLHNKSTPTLKLSICEN